MQKLSENKKVYQLFLTDIQEIDFYMDYWKEKAKTFIDKPKGYINNSFQSFNDIIETLERLRKQKRKLLNKHRNVFTLY